MLFPVLTGCAGLIARFDQKVLGYADTLKSEFTVLLEKAQQPYEQHREEVMKLLENLEKARQYAGEKSKNKLSLKQWEILIHLLRGLFNYWQDHQQLTALFIDEVKKIALDSFDEIIRLEKGKPELKISE
jgi:hypothetical protein